MFSTDLVENDIDNVSFYDNSMYVLPPKTLLNSEFFITDNDNLTVYGKVNQNRSHSLRKISNNVDIPTYKGFSIADGYSAYTKKNNIAYEKHCPTNYHSEKNVLRKVHIVPHKSETINKPSFKKIVKYKLGDKGDGRLEKKSHVSHEKSIKRTDTFLGDIDRIVRDRPRPQNVPSDHTKDKLSKAIRLPTNDKIIYYIKTKRDNLKKAEEENKFREEEEKEKIKERLKLLAEKAKSQNEIDKHTKKHQKRIKKQKLEELNELSVSSSQTDNSCKRIDNSSSESESLSQIIKHKLASWEPIPADELEIHGMQSRVYMKNAINTNRQTDNILSNILEISEKVNFARQELEKFIENRLVDTGKESHSFTKRKRSVSETDSYSDDVDGSGSKSYSSEGISRPVTRKINMKIKNDVKPIILANRARRTLLIDEKSDNTSENSDSDKVIPFSDLRDRLIEENQRRYERLVNPNQSILLPNFKSVHKPSAPLNTNNSRKLDVIKDMEKDSLTFMKTYQRCKHQSNQKVRKSISSAKKSKLSSKSSLPIDSVVRDSHQSIKDEYNVESTEDILSVDVSNDYFFSKNSERKKSQSLTKSKVSENVSESYNTSELNDTTENSILRHPAQQPIENKVPYTKTYRHDLQARLSPNSLERQLLVELHYYDTLQESMEQLLQSDRFQGVGFAQQETLSLAQVLKTRQWKDSQEDASNKNLQIFTEAIQNLNHHLFNKRRKPSFSLSTTSSASPQVESISDKSSTESEVSEIEEDIVDLSKATEPHRFNEMKYHQSSKQDHRGSKAHVKNIPITQNEHVESSIETVIEGDILQSNVEESVQEVSTALSVSKASSSESRMYSSREPSVIASIDTQSYTNKSKRNSHTKDFSSTQNKDELPSARSVKTDSNFSHSEKSAKEISTARSIETEIKSRNGSSGISKNTGSRSQSKSETDPSISTAGSYETETKSKDSKNMNSYSQSKSAAEHSISKTDISETNYSKDEFESNSEYQKSTSESEIMHRVHYLEEEKKKKEQLRDKLKKKVNIVKYRSEEKKLQNHINYLDSQIKTLKDDLENPNLSSSVILMSPISSKPQKIKDSTDAPILPHYNRKSSTSSSSVRDEESKSSSVSISSSTLTSEMVVNKSPNELVDNQKVDDAETPRSSRQIQFEDINEEYSASNRDSSDLKTPSEKSHLSKEEYVGTKSKSDNFHVLVLNKLKDDDQDSIVNENDDMKIISARTIHSEISEIPLEDDLSDQEIDDFFDKPNENLTEKTKSNSVQDLYSEDFSEITSQKTSKSHLINHSDVNEISNNEENFSYEPSESSKSTESSPPVIPMRKKYIESKIDTVTTVERICDNLLKAMIEEIMHEKEIIDKSKSKDTTKLINKDDELLQLLSGEEKIDINKIINESFELVTEQIPDSQLELIGKLIPWTDENVLPLVNLAVEQLFTARQARTAGLTREAFARCVDNMPPRFLETNSDEENRQINNQWLVYQALEMDSNEMERSFIPRTAIYHAVLEVMAQIYELDDESEPLPWMWDANNSARSKKLSLWQGVQPPESLQLVSKIVRNQLTTLKILTGCSISPMKKSRQHLWCIKQTNDPVDKLLINETFQEDWNWYSYDKAMEKTVYTMTDDIFEILLTDTVSDILGTCRS